MITQIQGKLVEKNPTHLVVDCHGVGYFINITLNTYSTLPQNEAIKLYTYLQIKEDAHNLYGFLTKAEREVFVLLISVSGVGAGTARTMLSSLTAAQVRSAIINGDVATIQSVKGIGAKTAQRVILDLKEKMTKLQDFEDIPYNEVNTNKEEALAALEVLGFVRKQAEKVVDRIIRTSSEQLSVEEIIKQALKNL
ncbi:Holliday junction ATP-dependent DNA helicase RuvA [Capnocytophaga canimorsus]|uniref:Holliday junction branch migration complex subunit RuvA n=1 Tax=Capnocytophaga canimorsus TaxID=28188 RepID=A0A0B7HKR5_9FLAO|nr:Holliday junction branch migration protein RuvA [Capnocytophaga canimorsus]ATA77311.1 Holliday junction branch migration protein RuvA [Capnocytophaga canimorsus]PJI83524.1 Holliday junction DNA helicase subunit RuvA [Capnocytophaga canimorsus]CEN39219.1 Holliday junction ATP-dependent DNA helicase RuvA [Capnocytophaga canimorsus]STA72553.1 Holliday junction ATP-dependent DNA helicase RuvA [Capnocytophaga canimorsus]